MTHRPEYIEDEIERTRLRIESRLDRLGEEFSVNSLLRSAVGANSNSPTDMLGAMASKARENPLSALLIGAGIANMMFNSGTDRNRRATQVSDLERYGESGDPAERIARKTAALNNWAGEVRDGLRDTATDVRSGLKESAATLKHRTTRTGETIKTLAEEGISTVEEAASDIRKQSREMAKEVERHAVSAGRQINEQINSTRERADAATNWVRDNPVPAGLVALAVGAAAASLFAARKMTLNGDAADDAGRRLEEEARETAADPDTRGAERFEELQDAAAHKAPARKRAAAKTPASKARAASAAGSGSTSASRSEAGKRDAGQRQPADGAAKAPETGTSK